MLVEAWNKMVIIKKKHCINVCILESYVDPWLIEKTISCLLLQMIVRSTELSVMLKYLCHPQVARTL